MLASNEISSVVHGIQVDCRADGRTRLQFRHFDVQHTIVPRAQGSAKVLLDQTEIIVGITCQVAECVRPEGRMIIHVDCSPNVTRFTSFSTSSKVFSSIISQRISGIFGGIEAGSERESSSSSGVPYEDLYLGHGMCFELHVDISVVSGESGNVLGATALAVKAALASTVLPNVSVSQAADGSTSVDVIRGTKQVKRLACSNVPVVLNFVLSDQYYASDPTLNEELALNTQLILALRGDGAICFSLLVSNGSKRGGTSCSVKDLTTLMEEAVVIGATIHDQLNQQIGFN